MAHVTIHVIISGDAEFEAKKHLLATATSVTFIGCENLTTINTPVATEVFAYDCENLTTINAPVATHVWVYDCGNMTASGIHAAQADQPRKQAKRDQREDV